MERERRRWSDSAAVGVAVGAISLTLFGVGFAAYLAGQNNGSSSTAPKTATSAVHVNPQVAAGAHAFVQFACAQCHGDHGAGGVSPDVPALKSIAASLTAAQLRSIINHGAGISSDPQRPFMPVWHGVIASRQVSALVAYMKAGFPSVPYADPVPIPSAQGDAVAGASLYQRYGCINCHGPNGLGGVPNPESPDTVIPPLVGADFHREFSDAAIAKVIRSGSVIGKAPIVSMPHWGTILTDQQIAELVAYIDTLTGSGK
jgi:mono/diheme cytochrome c family protein